MKVILFITFLIFIVTSCTTVKEAGQVLRNEKVKTTDFNSDSFAVLISSSKIFLCPVCTPSNVPIVTAVSTSLGKSSIE